MTTHTTLSAALADACMHSVYARDAGTAQIREHIAVLVEQAQKATSQAEIDYLLSRIARLVAVL